MKSIRKTLLLWLFAGLAGACVAAAVLIYQRATDEANKLFDDQMQQVALSLPMEGIAALHGRALGSGADGQLLVQWWDEDALSSRPDAPPGGLPLMTFAGFHRVNGPGGLWRVFAARVPGGVIQVAQPQWVRSERAASIALRTVKPMLLLFPLVAVLAWLGVANGLAPLRRLAREVGERSSESLQPVPMDGLPDEIRPLGLALNGLLHRLAQALDAQRSFVADAAHELRTPLTALKLQIQLAERAGDDAGRREAFAALQAGFERASHLVQQLLLLARQEPGKASIRHTPVRLDLVLDHVLELHSAELASGRLHLARLDAVTVEGDADSLAAMAGNLIDNALRYGRGTGQVEVSLVAAPDLAVLAVQDHGPGIPDTDMPRIFDRFYRVAGSASDGTGLGLAIVRRVVEIHGGQISLENTHPGLLATVTLPEKSGLSAAAEAVPEAD